MFCGCAIRAFSDHYNNHSTLLNPSYLLQLEDVLVEVVLQTFVGKVDAELFEAVVLVILKTENVQNSDGQDLKQGNRGITKELHIMRHDLDGEDQQHIPTAIPHLKQLSEWNHKLDNVVKSLRIHPEHFWL